MIPGCRGTLSLAPAHVHELTSLGFASRGLNSGLRSAYHLNWPTRSTNRLPTKGPLATRTSCFGSPIKHDLRSKQRHSSSALAGDAEGGTTRAAIQKSRQSN